VVTGAASGIGRATALAFARAGSNVAISDIDARGLEETRVAAESMGVRVVATRLDVSDRAAVYACAEETAAELGEVNVVVNNAGVACAGRIKDLSYDDLEWVMNIDFWGVVYGTKAFLPHLERARWGHVVNISSVFGMIAVPTQGAYNAAKFAVRGFTECLRQELEVDRSTVSATSVHPGGIKTAIAANARFVGAEDWLGPKDKSVKRFGAMARTSPEGAAAAIIDGVLRDAPRVLIGADAAMIDLGQRIFPTAYRAATKSILVRRR